jgi:gag-polypeptide of LTR copia-type
MSPAQMPHKIVSTLQTLLDISLTISPNISSISKLDGSNYPTWATYIKAAFQVHNLDCIIDGSETMPTDIKEALEFTCQTSQAYGLIILSLKESLHHLIDGHTTAKDLWDHLKKQYKKPGSLAVVLPRFVRSSYGPVQPAHAIYSS